MSPESSSFPGGNKSRALDAVFFLLEVLLKLGEANEFLGKMLDSLAEIVVDAIWF